MAPSHTPATPHARCISKCIFLGYNRPMARRSDYARFHRTYRFIENERICVYCGARATTIDHFAPLSVVSILSDIATRKDGRYLLPACGECNSTASNRMFRTVAAKRRYISDRYREKYRRVLAAPVWEQREIDEIGYELRSVIEKNERLRAYISARIQWRNTSNRSCVELAQIRFTSAAIGSASVLSNAEIRFIKRRHNRLSERPRERAASD